MTNISALNRGTLALAVSVLGSTVSCSGDSTTSPPDVSGSEVIEQLTPASVQAIAGSTIDPGPTIRLEDKRTGQPLADVKVEFLVSSAGYVDNPVTKTDASGVATAGRWVLGTRTGTEYLGVYVDKIRSSFSAVVKPDVPTQMSSFLRNIAGFAGELADPIAVNVYDRYGNATPGIKVTFAISAGDGTLDVPSGVTDPFGYTTTGPWRLGSTPGENTVVATAEGIAPERFTVQGIDSTSTTRFSLDSVRSGTQTAAPGKTGVSGSMLRITPFDQCLCRPDSGYYIVDVGYNNPATVEPARISGKYRIDAQRIIVTGGPLTSLEIVDGRLEVGIQRDDGDFRWTETWIYRAEVNQSASK